MERLCSLGGPWGRVATRMVAGLLLSVTAACGGGGGGGGGSDPAPTFSIGGTVNGLAGTLVLQNNAGDNLTVTASGGFTFSGKLGTGTGYAVTVLTQPASPRQTCTVSNGTGSVGSGNVTSVVVSCATNSYTIGGTITGLTGSGLVLRNNGGNDLSVPAGATSFTFAAPVNSGATYAVTALAQPANPAQSCAISNGAGTVGAANVTNVLITCTTNAYTIGGTISGLVGSGLVLRINGGNNLTIAANATSFTFPGTVLSGSPYAVTVLTQPTGPSQTCTASNGTGTVGSGNVTSVAVSCTTNSYTIGGTITGLTGSGLVLRNNGGNDLPVAAGATSFTFSAPVASGSTYAATVLTQPANQTCSLSNRTGTVVSSNVTSVGVICGGAPFTIGTLGDPLATQQWHLKNTGQTAFATNGGVAGFDVNVEPVYSTLGFTGLGVIVAVLDSGLQIAHEDLAVNVGGGGSWNFINGTTDPTNTTIDPSFNGREADHGTSVGGLIAMARNTVGGIGVAPSARLKGFNVLKSQTTANFVAALGGSASSPTSSDVSVFNQSYGLELTSDSQINSTIAAQYLAGVTNLRNGKGAIYVKSAGNSFGRDGSGGVLPGCSAADAAGVSCENANHDPENAIPYQIVVSALNAAGVKSSYSTAGSAIWVSAPGGEFGDDAPAMITTDQSGCTDGRSRTNAGSTPFDGGAAPNTQCNYRNTFNGTSSAAPVTAGVAALLLQANPDLTWRDVKHILASTARRVDAFRPALTVLLSNGLYVAERAWTTNVAGYRFHNWYGFGLIDAAAAVAMARNNYVPLAPLAVSPTLATPALGLAIPDNSVTGVTSSLTVPAGSVQVVEAVQITVSATHAASGDLGIELVSPSGTRSVLKNIRDRFGVSDDLNGMVLLSNAFYGEPAVGTWTLKVVDGFVAEVGTLTRWSIKIFGR